MLSCGTTAVFNTMPSGIIGLKNEKAGELP